MRVYGFLTFFCVLIVFIFCGFFLKSNQFRKRDYVEIADEITECVIKDLYKDLGLVCVGIGGGMMDSIHKMSMAFNFYHEVELQEARRLVVKASEKYLQEINLNKDVRPYLINYPFTSQEIEVEISFSQENSQSVPVGKICYIRVAKGRLRCDIEGSGWNGGPMWHEETYEEALRIVTEENKTSQLVMNVEK